MPILKRLHIEEYGCIRDLSIELPTGLHAFIGPNDSGKSTILRAVRTAVHLATESFLPPQASHGWIPFDPGFQSGRASTLQLDLDCGFRYRATVHPGPGVLIEEEADAGAKADAWRGSRQTKTWDSRGLLHESNAPEARFLREVLAAGARMIRLVPDQLRQASQLVPEGQESRALHETGFGIAGIYDVLQNRADGSFQRISNEICERFPAVKRLQLRNLDPNLKQLQIELEDGTRVPAPHMSEGLLYYLAFAALPELWSDAILLVEEPENGLHPARIADVVRALRRAADRSTVLVATHSPLVVNELEPDEVSVVSRPTVADGTRVRPMTQIPNLGDWQEVYALGELWVSMADGTFDHNLFESQAP